LHQAAPGPRQGGHPPRRSRTQQLTSNPTAVTLLLTFINSFSSLAFILFLSSVKIATRNFLYSIALNETSTCGLFVASAAWIAIPLLSLFWSTLGATCRFLEI
ncbi:uncharacterized protein EI90DRAFT_3036780, partial [Cantharellus anzutake]|uniref:uncharacterized protein n=1 Tax=Cantharellus anzutake TaxID=1750568 RepID=UPI00190857B6